jgi:hypothetical protein
MKQKKKIISKRSCETAISVVLGDKEIYFSDGETDCYKWFEEYFADFYNDYFEGQVMPLEPQLQQIIKESPHFKRCIKELIGEISCGLREGFNYNANRSARLKELEDNREKIAIQREKALKTLDETLSKEQKQALRDLEISLPSE